MKNAARTSKKVEIKAAHLAHSAVPEKKGIKRHKKALMFCFCLIKISSHLCNFY